MMLVVNKWDLVPEEQRQRFKQSMERRIRFATYTPIIYVSAKLRQGINRILPRAWEIWQEIQKRIPQATVDELVKQAVSSYPPPRTGSRRLHVRRAYQDVSQPVTFVLEVNDPKLVHFSYQRYLGNKLRQSFGFRGVPLKLIFTKPARKINRKIDVRA
jgi:GTP-binding protein